jgi:hypothetical protein
MRDTWKVSFNGNPRRKTIKPQKTNAHAIEGAQHKMYDTLRAGPTLARPRASVNAIMRAKSERLQQHSAPPAAAPLFSSKNATRFFSSKHTHLKPNLHAAAYANLLICVTHADFAKVSRLSLIKKRKSPLGSVLNWRAA